MKTKIALMYIRNGHEVIFPVKDIDHAIRLAEEIADSDLLNDNIDFNLFDVFYYDGKQCGDAWESDDGYTFEDVWRAKSDWVTE